LQQQHLHLPLLQQSQPPDAFFVALSFFSAIAA
jgi:hypothetical protein